MFKSLWEIPTYFDIRIVCCCINLPKNGLCYFLASDIVLKSAEYL